MEYTLVCLSESVRSKGIRSTNRQDGKSWFMWGYKRPPPYTGDVREWDWLLAQYLYSLIAVYARSNVIGLEAGLKNTLMQFT